MLAADAGQGDDLTGAGRFYQAGFRSVLGPRQIRTAMGIVAEVPGRIPGR